MTSEKSITVRGVPAETVHELAARANLTGRSLQEYLRTHLMLLAEHPDADAFVAGLRRRKTATASRVSAETILRHRDAGRQ